MTNAPFSYSDHIGTQLKKKFKGKVEFQIVDADSGGAGAELMKKYGVSSYPTVVYVDKDGKNARQYA